MCYYWKSKQRLCYESATHGGLFSLLTSLRLIFVLKDRWNLVVMIKVAVILIVIVIVIVFTIIITDVHLHHRHHHYSAVAQE